MTRKTFVRRGFSLVELLTVIAIIALLISIAVPALQAARDQGKRITTQGTIKSLDEGCHMFQKEQGNVPVSRGNDPFEQQPYTLSGAQWLTLQLSGPDGQGYVPPVVANDTNKDGIIDYKDWQNWYPNVGDPNYGKSKNYARSGPYAPADSKYVRILGDPNSPSGSTFLGENPGLTPPTSLTQGSAPWPIWSIPFYVDAWGYPILYYAANPRAPQAFTTGTASGGNMILGIYDESDNAQWTGSDGQNGLFPLNQPSFVFSKSVDQSSAYAKLGYTVDAQGVPQAALPEPETFAGCFTDRRIYDQTNRGTGGQIRPYKSDSFILVSPGKDGIYGPVNNRTDDVKNFEN